MCWQLVITDKVQLNLRNIESILMVKQVPKPPTNVIIILIY